MPENNTSARVHRITPTRGLNVLSHEEVARLRESSMGSDLLRQCALAVLNCGANLDDPHALLELNKSFKVQVLQQDRGIKLELTDPPPHAFVDGVIIEGIRELLFDVLRDVVYVGSMLEDGRWDLSSSHGITDAVFSILRHAEVMVPGVEPNMVVCWGGHSIPRHEYEYTKKVGYELGLRGVDICTGCGPGAMKGPMKGANIAHAKQRRTTNRYVGISEPGIIAAESPNPIVNQLVIMPDIEKRLEAFVRLGHGVIVFPGGVGTAEEILYLLGILLEPANAEIPFPMILTGPKESEDYFTQIDEFIGFTLGDAARARYRIIIDDPVEVARHMVKGLDAVRREREESKGAFFFNWGLTIPEDLQKPFEPTHENVASLAIHRDQSVHNLAAQLRRVFSAIVAGNVKQVGMEAIARYGKYEINGEAEIMGRLDNLLKAFVAQHRMKLPGTRYEPCYTIRSV